MCGTVSVCVKDLVEKFYFVLKELFEICLCGDLHVGKAMDRLFNVFVKLLEFTMYLYKMSQEFYLKTRALHEEFQKRELHYLNTERKLRSSIMSKQEFNLPFQEYLQRINQREKESEETYRTIMKQMEELDRHTDVMSFKLEKLGILRNSLTSFTLPNWPSNIGSNLQTYNAAQNFSSKSNDSRLELLELNTKSSFQTNKKAIATQTENAIYCEKCRSLIHSQPRYIMENESLPIFNSQSMVSTETLIVHSKPEEDFNKLNTAHSSIQPAASSADGELTIKPVNVDKSFVVENSKMAQQATEKVPSENINLGGIQTERNSSIENSEMARQANQTLPSKNIHSGKILTERNSSVENRLQTVKNSTENKQDIVMRNEEKLTESQHSEMENYESKSPDVEINVDTVVSKSDEESMNNEFDFLESDTRITSSKTKPQNVSKVHNSPPKVADKSLGKASLKVQHPIKSSAKHKESLLSNTKLELGDNRSETSGSVSAPHSPIISVASDSDSTYEKGSPLTASAAYQALLGNTVIPKNTKSDNSDSESEDDVENALANVVQKSHIKSKSSKPSQIAEAKRKPSSEAIDPKPAVKGSKLPTSSKPQSKLSKSTRKVLGLDTSSGSEVELAVKSPEKKIDEDSDEFDFFD